MHSPQRVNIGSGPAEFKPLVAHSFSVWLVRRIVPDLRLVDFYFILFLQIYKNINPFQKTKKIIVMTPFQMTVVYCHLKRGLEYIQTLFEHQNELK
jgi:hypothetical protein